MKCPGCATSFKEGEKLVMEGLHIQYKNYNLPIKEEKPARTLLKTIVSFLNSKGGTIYIGVEDSKGQVKGVSLQQDDRQNFVVFVTELSKRIRPEVTCSTSDAQIKIQFVPVVGKKQFEGKYLAKIIVKQGDPARIYCFGHKIKIQNGHQALNHEAFYSYFRHNMGGLEQLKGLNLLKQIRNRALNPLKATNIFHTGCNPEPLNLQETSYAISILKVSADEFKEISQLFKEQMSIIDVDFKAVHSDQRQALMVKFEDLAQFQKVKSVLDESIDYLNSQSRTFTFKIKEIKKREVILLKNHKYKPQKDDEEQKTDVGTKKQETEKQKTDTTEKVKKKYIKSENSQKKQIKKEVNKIQQIKEQQKAQNHHNIFKIQKKEDHIQLLKETPKKASTNFPKKYSLTFTYLNFNKTKEFSQFLQSINPGLKYQSTPYHNSIQLFFLNEQDKQIFNLAVVQFYQQMKQFSFKGRGVSWGNNTKILTISHYDNKKRQLLQQQLSKMIKNQLNISYSVKQEQKGKKSPQFLVLEMSRPDFACKWLDKLLQSPQWKNKYSIPGKGHKVAKITVVLELENHLLESESFQINSDDDWEQCMFG